MGNTRDLFKKIRDTKQTFSSKDGHNKVQKQYRPNRSRRYYEKGERIHRRTLQKKYLNDLDNHDGVITHLDPGILECSKVGLRKHH